MFDIKWIRENQQKFDRALARRGVERASETVIALDDERRDHVTRLQAAQETRNSASREIGKAKASGNEEAANLAIAQVAKLKSFIQQGEEKQRVLAADRDKALAVLPNMPFDDVPDGNDESANVEISVFGEKPQFDFTPKEHFELGEASGQMDFESAAKMSGSRFVVLRGDLARLERALGQFMLDLHTENHGYTEISAPLLVRDRAVYGAGQLPKFAEDLFHTEDGRWLISTAEVPLTNLARERVFEVGELPLRVTALTQCFRSEAGSAGRDTRGMLRQHQFAKVEMVSITKQEESSAELQRILGNAEEVLKQLDLHYRVVLLCAGDMGVSARKTFDIEVWLPGQAAYREISSCTICDDYQARRMNARYRHDKQLLFCHTLNGSGVAVGRALIAVLENNQNQDGSITIPKVLQSYMGGKTLINGSK